MKKIKKGSNQRTVFINKLCSFHISSVSSAKQVPNFKLNFINELNPYLASKISLIKPITAFQKIKPNHTRRKSKKNNHSDSDLLLNDEAIRVTPIQTNIRPRTFQSRGQVCEPKKYKHTLLNYQGPDLRLYSDESFDCFSEFLTPIKTKNVSRDSFRTNTISELEIIKNKHSNGIRRTSKIETNKKKIVRLKKNVLCKCKE